MPGDEVALALTVHVADNLGEQYYQELVIDQLLKFCGIKGAVDIPGQLDDPHMALSVLYRRYAFARRGKDKEDIGYLSAKALKHVIEEQPGLFGQQSGEPLWDKFVALCAQESRKSNEQQNRGPIQGLLELAQEVYELTGSSICAWIREAIRKTGRVEPLFDRIVDIRGLGPKNTSFLLRDMVALYDLEDQVDRADHIYLQAVDRWSRLFATHLVPELVGEEPDWIVAGKMSKLAHQSEVSVIKLSMGASLFGMRTVREPERFQVAITSLEAKFAQ